MSWKEKFFDILTKLNKPYQLVKMDTSCRSIENDGWFEKEYGILFEGEERSHWLGCETTHDEDEENNWHDGDVLYDSDLNYLSEDLYKCFCDSLSEFINEDETSGTKNQKDNISNSGTIFDNMEKDFNQFIDNANHFIEKYKQKA